MKQGKHLDFKHFIRFGTGTGMVEMAEKAIMLALGVMLARWLGPEKYGVYAFSMAMMALLLIPAKFGMPDLMLRNVAASRDTKPGIIRRLILQGITLTLCTSILVLTASWLIVSWLDLFGRSDLHEAFTIALLLLPTLALLKLSANSLCSLGRIVTARFLDAVFPSLVVLGLISIPLLLGDDSYATPSFVLAVRVLGTALAVMLIFALLFRRAPSPADEIPHGSAKRFLSDAFPFLLIGAGNILMSRTDIVMLGAMSGDHAVGIYNVAVQGGIFVVFALQVTNTVIAPEFARLYAKGDFQNLQRVALMGARTTALISIPIAAVLILWGEAVLTLVFGEAYKGGATALAILAAGHFISILYGSPGFLLNMSGHETVSLRILSAAVVTNIVLNLLLIPTFGLNGAAAATALSLILWKVAAQIFVKRHLGINCAAFSRERVLS